MTIRAAKGDDLDLIIAQRCDAADAIGVEQCLPGFFSKAGGQDAVSRGRMTTALEMA